MAGLNNWIDFNYDEKRCILDMSSLDTSIDKEDAIDIAVESISKRYQNLYISMSGGIDSEFTANCFLKRGIPFTPLIVDYISNGAEVWWAYRWCYLNGITPDVIRLSQHDYVKLSWTYAELKNTSFSSALDFIMEKYASKKHGSLLLSTPEPFNKIDCISDTFEDPGVCELHYASYDFMLDYHNPEKHPYNFLSYTPEMVYNMVRGVDPEKPLQHSITEYYGVDARPKIPVFLNLAMLRENAINSISKFNSDMSLFKIKLGFRDSFLAKCESKSCIHGEFVKRPVDIVKKIITHVNLNEF
jgi:hypothetical protein